MSRIVLVIEHNNRLTEEQLVDSLNAALVGWDGWKTGRNMPVKTADATGDEEGDLDWLWLDETVVDKGLDLDSDLSVRPSSYTMTEFKYHYLRGGEDAVTCTWREGRVLCAECHYEFDGLPLDPKRWTVNNNSVTCPVCLGWRPVLLRYPEFDVIVTAEKLKQKGSASRKRADTTE